MPNRFTPRSWKRSVVRASRIPLSGQNLTLGKVAEHHDDVVSSLRFAFDIHSPFATIRFPAATPAEINARLGERLLETEIASVMNALAAIEARFRVDYLERTFQKRKDRLSRELRHLYAKRGARASLEEEILVSWKMTTDVPHRLISELKSAFKYRHWIAHGRYWSPKLGQKYDFFGIHTLAQLVESSFPFVSASKSR
jgi:hypothetical protein